MYKQYLRDFDKFTAMRTEIVNPARDTALRLGTALNLLAAMRLRGIKVNHRPSSVDLFTFAIAFDQLITHTTFDIDVVPKGVT